MLSSLAVNYEHSQNALVRLFIMHSSPICFGIVSLIAMETSAQVGIKLETALFAEQWHDPVPWGGKAEWEKWN